MDPQVLASLLGLGYGENVEIPYEELHIPEEFQRQLKPRNWETFVPALFGRVIVAEVDGVNETCDGIHRVREGAAHGMWATQDVPSVRFAGCTKQQAAAIFNLANKDRVALAAADQFRSACASGDARALALDASLLEIGLDGWCKNRSERDLTAVGTVVWLESKYGLEHTMSVLDFISECWGWVDRDDVRYSESSPHARIVKGFGEYLRPLKRFTGRRYPRRWDPANATMLSTYVSSNFPGQEGHTSFLVRAANRKAPGGGGGMALGVEQELHDCFLKAKRQQRAAEQQDAA